MKNVIITKFNDFLYQGSKVVGHSPYGDPVVDIAHPSDVVKIIQSVVYDQDMSVGNLLQVASDLFNTGYAPVVALACWLLHTIADDIATEIAHSGAGTE